MTLKGLKPGGKQALDAFLDEVVRGRQVPAAFLGATTGDEEIYFACGGDKVFGRPEQGQVNADSSAFSDSPLCPP